MKKIICFLCFLLAVTIIASLLGGCSNNAGEYKETECTRFVVIERDIEGPWDSGTIIADCETGVLYLMFYRYGQSGITPLLNTNGSPMIWDRWEGN